MSLYHDLGARLGCDSDGQAIRRAVDDLLRERDDWKALAMTQRRVTTHATDKKGT